MLHVEELVQCEGHFHGEEVQEFLLASFVVVLFDNAHHTVPDDIGDVHSDAFSHECVATLLVDDGSLLVHHVIIFEQSLSDAEVVLFHFLLCFLNALRNDGTLDALSFFESQSVHYSGDAFCSEESHEFVFE